MRKALALVVVGLIGCSPTGRSSGDDKPAVSPSESEPETTAKPEQEVPEEPEPEPEASPIEVAMTAATLADDCGGAPNIRAQATPAAAPKEKRSVGRADTKRRGKTDRGRMAKRACKQSSIQLSVTASKDATKTQLAVKSVELLLTSGESLGMLQTREPSVWSDDGGYGPWDESVSPGQDLSVSYAITQPQWDHVKDRKNQTYTVKAVVSIAGADQTLEQNVVVDVPASLPPNVRT